MVFQYNPTLSVGLSLNSNDTLSFLSTNSAESAPLVQFSKLLLVLYILIQICLFQRERERERIVTAEVNRRIGPTKPQKRDLFIALLGKPNID